MKKVFLAVLIIFARLISANAQPTEGFSLGAGIRLGLPVGDFADVSSFGVGGELQVEYGFSEMFSGIFTTGYSSFFGKDYDTGLGTVKTDATGYIPIIIGARVYPSATFFIGAQVGYGRLTGRGSSYG